MYKILLVEDNQEYAATIKKALEKKQYDVLYVEDPIDAIKEFAKSAYDLVISDYLMSRMNGVELLTALKDIRPEIKSIILTGFPEEEVELDALELQVDRYLSKDKSIHLLVRYIEQILQQTEGAGQLGDTKLISKEDHLVINTLTREVFQNGQLVSVTRKEYDLLVLFLRNKGKSFDREEIARSVWTTDVEDFDLRAIDGHIRRMRRKLKLFSIVSLRGYGYKWNE